MSMALILMLRSVVFNRHEYSAAMIKAEMNRINEFSFVNAWFVGNVLLVWRWIFWDNAS